MQWQELEMFRSWHRRRKISFALPTVSRHRGGSCDELVLTGSKSHVKRGVCSDSCLNDFLVVGLLGLRHPLWETGAFPLITGTSFETNPLCQCISSKGMGNFCTCTDLCALHGKRAEAVKYKRWNNGSLTQVPELQSNSSTVDQWMEGLIENSHHVVSERIGWPDPQSPNSSADYLTQRVHFLSSTQEWVREKEIAGCPDLRAGSIQQRLFEFRQKILPGTNVKVGSSTIEKELIHNVNTVETGCERAESSHTWNPKMDKSTSCVWPCLGLESVVCTISCNLPRKQCWGVLKP